jgi:hypothetical protein
LEETNARLDPATPNFDSEDRRLIAGSGCRHERRVSYTHPAQDALNVVQIRFTPSDIGVTLGK